MTEEEKEAVREYFNQNLSYSAMALKLGVTRNVIAGRCRRLGLVRDPSEYKGRSSSMRIVKRRIDPPPLPVVVDPEPAESGQGALEAVMAAHSRSCRFPFGDPRRQDFRYCGEVTDPGKSYCSEHFPRIFYIRD